MAKGVSARAASAAIGARISHRPFVIITAMGKVSPAAIIALCLLSSCGCGGRPSSGLARPPEYKPGGGQGKCSVKGGQAKPLIVEWPSGARGDLELQARKGIVAVRYVGCEMEILSRCTAPGTYKYGAFTAKGDKVVIRNEDELYANIPVGAAKLESKLQSTGQLTVEMKLVGKYEADRDQLRLNELQGACDDATHFIAGLTVGAFEFFAGAEGEIGGGASVAGVGAGARSASRRESLMHDGSSEACGEATAEDSRPPSGCGAILRLEVVPLTGSQSAKSSPAWPARSTTLAPQPAVPAPAPPVKAPSREEQLVDVIQAMARAKQSCDGGNMGSCYYLALRSENGYESGHDRLPKDYARAAALYEQICNNGLLPVACFNLGAMYESGRGVPKDVPRAITLYQRACTNGDSQGCDALHRLGGKP